MGKRTRYVSPLALFLFTIFVMFMALSYLPHPKASLGEQRAVAAAKLARVNTDLANAEARLAKAPPEGRAEWRWPRLGEGSCAARAKSSQGGFHRPGQHRRHRRPEGGAGQGGRRPGRLAFQHRRQGDGTEADGETQENPELALYKLQQTFYKFSFLLVPISIPFVALLFLWKKGFTLYDHGVFVSLLAHLHVDPGDGGGRRHPGRRTCGRNRLGPRAIRDPGAHVLPAAG